MNEIRYYLEVIKDMMHHAEEPFVPKYIVTAVQLPSGAIELAVNNEKIEEKIDYILEAYDEDMKLKSNPNVVMSNLMVI